MAMVVLKGTEAFITDPNSEEGQVQNLLLNMMSGLEWQHLSEEEKALMQKHGYNPENEK